MPLLGHVPLSHGVGSRQKPLECAQFFCYFRLLCFQHRFPLRYHQDGKGLFQLSPAVPRFRPLSRAGAVWGRNECEGGRPPEVRVLCHRPGGSGSWCADSESRQPQVLVHERPSVVAPSLQPAGSPQEGTAILRTPWSSCPSLLQASLRHPQEWQRPAAAPPPTGLLPGGPQRAGCPRAGGTMGGRGRTR